jgi:hypothetical protein
VASGGARANSGPPPNPESLRQDRADVKAGWVTLSAAGRQGPVPEWPLAAPMCEQELVDEDGKKTYEYVLDVATEKRELLVWSRQWKRPQAIMWERNGQEEEVALYVRTLVAAEDAGAKANVRTLVKQQQEALGLSLPGLARNGWKIAEVPKDDGAAKPAVKRAGMTVIKGGKDSA